METIHKAKINADYVVIPNSLAQDNRLSFEARGVLVMLLSMPDDWSVNKSWLIKQTKAGRDKVTSIIKELELCGYMSKRTTHDQLGKITGIQWHVYHYDTVERISRRTGEPSDGKTPTTKETSLQSKQETNNTQPKGFECELFNKFWDAYGKKKSKDKCIAKWKKLSNENKEDILRVVRAYVTSTPDVKFRKNPLTWLNGKCWEDDTALPTEDKLLDAIDSGFKFFCDSWIAERQSKLVPISINEMEAKMQWVNYFDKDFFDRSNGVDSYDLMVNKIHACMEQASNNNDSYWKFQSAQRFLANRGWE